MFCLLLFVRIQIDCCPLLDRSLARFLLSKGHDEEAIAVVHYIAKFNKAPVPSLTIEHFQALDQADERSIASTDPLNGGQVKLSTKEHAKTVGKGALGQFKHLKGLFATKRMIWLTISIWLSYVSASFFVDSIKRRLTRFCLECRSPSSSPSPSPVASSPCTSSPS